MPTLTVLLPYLLASFAISAVPGISVSALISAALGRGLVAGLWQEVGAQLGRFSMVLIVAIALQAISGVVSAVFDVIKYVGAAYLVWLSWGYLSKRHSLSVEGGAPPLSPVRQTLSGFLVVWSNPKALIFFGAFLPQFVDLHRPAWPQVIILGLTYMFAAAVTDSIYIAVVALARGAITGARIELVNRLAGVVLLGAAVWLATLRQS
ncbi:MAG: LysE family translocator [Devosia sp.]|nr:LysE family translocator [Devosia sp.]